MREFVDLKKLTGDYLFGMRASMALSMCFCVWKEASFRRRFPENLWIKKGVWQNESKFSFSSVYNQ